VTAQHGARMALIAGLAALAPWSVTPAGARTAGQSGCKAKRVALRYQPRGHKKAVRWCLKAGAKPHTAADAAVAIEQVLERGRLAPRRLERRVPRLSARLRRAFLKARTGQLRRTTVAPSGARAAGPATSTHSEGPIEPGPNQAGFGFHSETTSSKTGDDAERSTVTTTQTSKSRHELFGPKCPDSYGNVDTKINIVHSSIRSIDRRGKLTTITTDARITGFISGGFNDDFALRAPLKVELDLVVETRVLTVITLTGKVVSREPTNTRRIALSGSVATEGLGAIESISDAADAMKITGASGPKGVLTNDDIDESLALTTLGSLWMARTEGRAAFAKTIGNATGYKCVVAEATPDALTLDAGESGTFNVTVRGLDDSVKLPLSSDSRVYSGNLTLSPLANKIHGPESGTTFKVTSGGGKGVAEVSSVSRRGYGGTLKIPITPRPVFVPKRYSGSYSGTSNLNTGTGPVPLTATFDGVVALAPMPAMGPAIPGVTPPIFYRIESGTVHLLIQGVIDGCTWLAEGNADLLADPGASLLSPMNITLGAPMTYSLVLPAPYTATIPGTISGCPNPADDHPISWPVVTGIAALVNAPPAQPLGPGELIAGSASGRTDPSAPLQTWIWNLVAQ
jgi:hypothetical protein